MLSQNSNVNVVQTEIKSTDLEMITLSNFHNELAHTCTPAGKQEHITAFQSTQFLQKELPNKWI